MKVLPADATGDGAAVGGLSYAYTTDEWSPASDFGNYVRGATEYVWSDTDGGTPNSYKTISQVLRIVGALNSTADLPSLTSNVELDGSATISVVYL